MFLLQFSPFHPCWNIKTSTGTCMRLVIERTWQTGLQIKLGLLCLGGGHSAGVSSENKRPFGSQWKETILIYPACLYINFWEAKRHLEFLWQRKLQFCVFLHRRAVSGGCWRRHRRTCVLGSSPQTSCSHYHVWLRRTCKPTRACVDGEYVIRAALL